MAADRPPRRTDPGDPIMCGRYTLHARREALADAFDLDEVPELPLRYNIAPTQNVPVVRLDPDSGRRRVAMLRWGLIPSWADDPTIGNRMINARAETVASKPAFRSAFRRRRCLVLADGFYEWAATGGKAKTPFHFRRRDGRPFAFAGLWERREKGPQPVESCTLITTEPNAVVAPVHDRMPAILRPEHYQQWLDPDEQGADELDALLGPLPDELMEGFTVGRLVNSPSRDDPRCIEPAG